MDIRIPALAMLALAATLAASRTSTAQEGPGMEAMRANCGGDYLRFCAGMRPDGPEVKACFRRNRPSLSVGCSQAIVAYERTRAGSAGGAQR
jgi:hypothetical protein